MALSRVHLYPQNGLTLLTEPIMAVLERASVCTLDCPDTCSLTVTVDNGRIVKVREIGRAHV